MKKLLLSAIAVIASSVFLMSCESSEDKLKQQVEEMLVTSLKSPSSYKFVSFEKGEPETLGGELEDRIQHFQRQEEFEKKMYAMDSSHISFMKEMGWTQDLSKDVEKLAEKKKEIEKDTEFINYLRSIKEEKANSLDSITFNNYCLVYDADNSFGASLRDSCFIRVNTTWEIVSIKYTAEDSWNNLGKFFSIPNYYEKLGIDFK